MCQSWLKNASFQQERERKKVLISWHLQPAALVSRAVLQRSRMSFQIDVNHGSESFPVNTVIERLKVYRQGTDSICYSLCLVYSNSICARQQQVTISLKKKIERLCYVFQFLLVPLVANPQMIFIISLSTTILGQQNGSTLSMSFYHVLCTLHLSSLHIHQSISVSPWQWVIINLLELTLPTVKETKADGDLHPHGSNSTND